MRILVASGQWFPDFRGGSARVATDTARALAHRGHDVMVLAPRNGRRATVESQGRLTIRRVLARNGLPNTFTDVFETFRHARRAGPGAFDVLVAHQSTTGAGLAAAGLDAPLVRVFHAPAALERRFLRSRLASLPRRVATYPLEPALAALDRISIGRAARVLVLSEYSASLVEHVDRGGRRKVRLAAGGVNVNSFTPAAGVADARARLGVPPGERLLVTVRRLEPRMGLAELLQALPAVCRVHEATLAVIGDGTQRSALERLSAELELNGRVRFIGRVPDDELHDWYRAADLFVLPTVAYEGFGLVTAEALASGAPVVGTPVGATPELLAPLDPRLITRSADPAALAEGISDALSFTDDAFRRKCRAYARARFDWSTAIVSWEEALVETVGPPRRDSRP